MTKYYIKVNTNATLCVSLLSLLLNGTLKIDSPQTLLKIETIPEIEADVKKESVVILHK